MRARPMVDVDPNEVQATAQKLVQDGMGVDLNKVPARARQSVGECTGALRNTYTYTACILTRQCHHSRLHG